MLLEEKEYKIKIEKKNSKKHCRKMHKHEMHFKCNDVEALKKKLRKIVGVCVSGGMLFIFLFFFYYFFLAFIHTFCISVLICYVSCMMLLLSTYKSHYHIQKQ